MLFLLYSCKQQQHSSKSTQFQNTDIFNELNEIMLCITFGYRTNVLIKFLIIFSGLPPCHRFFFKYICIFMLVFKGFISFFVNTKNFAIFKCRAKGRLINKILLARNEHVIDIFTSEDMENILLCISRYLTAYYIINNNMTPLNISNLFISAREVNKCNTRFSSGSSFYVKNLRLDKLQQKSFSRKGVRMWNSVSDDLCNSSKNKFKKKLNDILFSILIEEEDSSNSPPHSACFSCVGFDARRSRKHIMVDSVFFPRYDFGRKTNFAYSIEL